MVPYRAAFPLQLTRTMMGVNFLLLGIYLAVIYYLAKIFTPSDTLMSGWSDAGQIILAITTVPLTGLFAAYDRVQARLDGPPPRFCSRFHFTSIELTLGTVVLSLVVAIALLFMHHILTPTQLTNAVEAIEVQSSLLAVAAGLAVVNFVAMFVAFLAIAAGWDNCRRWDPNQAEDADENDAHGHREQGNGQQDEQRDAYLEVAVRIRIVRDLALAGIGAIASTILLAVRRQLKPPR